MHPKPPRVRFTLRSKILLGMVGTVLAALVPTALVVNDWLSKSVEWKIEQDFTRAELTFVRIQQMTDSLLAHEARTSGEDPAFVAATVAGDQAGVRAALGYGPLDLVTWDLYAIVRADGATVWSGGALLGTTPDRTTATMLAAALGGGAPNGACVLAGVVYEAIARPLVANGEIVGAMLIGARIDQDLIENLRAMSGSDVALIVEGRITLCTLTPPQRESLESWLGGGRANATGPNGTSLPPLALVPPDEHPPSGSVPSLPVTLDRERHVCAFLPILDAERNPVGDFLLFQSVDRPIGFFDTLRQMLFFIGAIAGSLAILFAMVIARGVTRDVNELVRGVREVARGNYDHRITHRTRDEVGYLASTFDDMRVSLRDQLEQSRWLTQVVSAKNVDLQAALTELQRTQEELVKSERLAVASRLFAQLSHELNNPVYNIQTCVEVLRRHMPANDPNREYVDLVYAEVLRMGRLSKQMLGFASPARDEMGPTDLNAVLVDLLQVSTRWLEEKGIAVEKRLGSALPKIHASPDQLRQVFLNLFVNASDAMPDGGRLTVETEAVDGTVLARVRDTGRGISRENRSKIFDAFFTTKSAAIAGAGLGLSISYGIVARHRGRIEVESEPGEGACFTVSFPVLTASSQGGS
jgi:signal transduction histidine kinase